LQDGKVGEREVRKKSKTERERETEETKRGEKVK